MAFRARVTLILAMTMAGFGHVSGAENAVVSRLTVYPGQEIRLDILTDIDVTNCHSCAAGFIQDRSALNGMIANKTILVGRLIYPDQIRKPPAVLQRQHVDISYVFGALTIIMRGEALDTGAIGDTIHVRNLDSGMTIGGIVNAVGSVSAGTR